MCLLIDNISACDLYSILDDFRIDLLHLFSPKARRKHWSLVLHRSVTQKWLCTLHLHNWLTLSFLTSNSISGQTWIGLIVKATYSFFGVEPDDKVSTPGTAAGSGQDQVEVWALTLQKNWCVVFLYFICFIIDLRNILNAAAKHVYWLMLLHF